MPTTDHYDVIIIGTGAGGGTLAHELARTGKRILILERGDFIPRELENWDTKAVFGDKRYLARETWYDRNDQPFSPYTHYCVGGNTKVYGAALLRFRESDFREVRHFGGVSPAWPISYADLEPYYTRAERLYNVHGDRGSDPHEPAASASFPHPPIPPEPHIRELMENVQSIGLRPFPVPLAVRLDDADPTQSPYRLSKFDGYPDLTEVKSDAHVVGIKPILNRRHVTLLTRTKAQRLETDATGRVVTRVIVDRDGECLEFSGDTIVLACGAINSAALLLRSRSAQHPTGLANTSDQVGRNYMCHQNGCFVAVTQRENPSQFQKHFALTDFYKSAPDSPFPLGTIQLMGKPDPWTLEWLRGELLPGVALDDIAKRTIDFFLTAEDLPHPDNRITLKDDASIRVAYTHNNTEAYDRLERRLRDILAHIERSHGRLPPEFLSARLGVGGVSHQNGTVRFGTDPRSSVLDTNCKAHDLENLYVVDASFFPCSAAVNPSLTIMANALRVAEHLCQTLGASATHTQKAMSW